MRRALVVALAGAIVTTSGCGSKSRSDGGSVVSASLRPGVVARVGTTEVSAETVARIAKAQGIDLRRARDLAVRDALFAAGGTAGGIGTGEAAALGADAVLARLVLRQIAHDAEAAGPVTDEELAAVTKRHWQQIDRPPAYRTVHAVIRLDEKAPDDTRRQAAVLAEAIRRALEPAHELAATTPRPETSNASGGRPADDPVTDAFRRAVDAVPHEGLDVVVEELPPVTSDGRVVGTDGTFDERFARGAATLAHRGDISQPTASAFGLHVILLLEIIPPNVVPVEERRRLVHDEVMTDRARASMRGLLERLRGDALYDRNADVLLADVPVEAPSPAGAAPR